MWLQGSWSPSLLPGWQDHRWLRVIQLMKLRQLSSVSIALSITVSLLETEVET
jgi:hypothetical protein